MIQLRKLNLAVEALQVIREQLKILDTNVSLMNEDTIKALKTNPDYKDCEDFGKNFIEFKVYS